jgi:hypothetical protein
MFNPQFIPTLALRILANAKKIIYGDGARFDYLSTTKKYA